MRNLAILVFAAALAAVPAHAADCPSGAQWRVDHYVYDASLHRDWEVLVNCEQPTVPARMRFVPDVAGSDVADPDVYAQNSGKKIAAPAIDDNAAHARAENDFPAKRDTKRLPPPPARIAAGTAVDVTNAPGAPVSIHLSGMAMQTAFADQAIRVRLSANGRFVEGVVRGPHSVELVEGDKPVWGKP